MLVLSQHPVPLRVRHPETPHAVVVRHLLLHRPSPSPSPSPEEEEEDSVDGMQNPGLDDEAAALRLRAMKVARQFTDAKQVATARDLLAAQERQLRNLTMGDTRTSTFTAPVAPTASMTARSPIDSVQDLESVATMFPSVARRYLEDIYHCRLEVKQIMRFVVNPSSDAASDTADAFDAKNMLDLIREFQIFAFIVMAFVPHLAVRWELQRAITIYT